MAVLLEKSGGGGVELIKMEVILGAIEQMVNDLKNRQKDLIEILILVKSGNFYKSYSADAIILHNLTGYQLMGQVNQTCGFPLKSLDKVKYLLDEKSVSYIVIENSKKPEIKNIDYQKENRYTAELIIANLNLKKEIATEELKMYLDLAKSRADYVDIAGNLIKEIKKIISKK